MMMASVRVLPTVLATFLVLAATLATGLTAAAQAPTRIDRQDQGARQAARRRQARHPAVRLPQRQERAGRLRHRPGPQDRRAHRRPGGARQGDLADPHPVAGERQRRPGRRLDDPHARARQGDRFQHHLLHRRAVAAGAEGEPDRQRQGPRAASRWRCSRARRWKRTSPAAAPTAKVVAFGTTPPPGSRWRRAASTRSPAACTSCRAS